MSKAYDDAIAERDSARAVNNALNELNAQLVAERDAARVTSEDFREQMIKARAERDAARAQLAAHDDWCDGQGKPPRASLHGEEPRGG